MTDIPTIEPAVVTAGDTWKWRRSLAEYPASGGWSLRYVFANATQRYSFDSVASGDEHLISRATADTDDIVPGRYQWMAFARNGTERYQIGAGTIEVRPNVEGARPWDARSHARKVLEAIEAVLENRATRDQEEYTIGDRSLKRTPIKDLMVLRDTYRLEVQREEAAERSAAGLPNPRMARVRFQRV